MTKILLIGTGGFVGSIFRYLLSGLTHRVWHGDSTFPYGTLLVNLIGCLLIGFLGGLTESRQLFPPEVRLFMLIGLLGGFTTFSTFGYETFGFVRDGQWLPAVFNVVLHVTFGVGAVWLGSVFSRFL